MDDDNSSTDKLFYLKCFKDIYLVAIPKLLFAFMNSSRLSLPKIVQHLWNVGFYLLLLMIVWVILISTIRSFL